MNEQLQNPRVYCSENIDEPLWGTADVVDVWLLLEYRPTWKGKAVEDNALAANTRQWLEQTIATLDKAGLRARPQFVRRPELDDDRTRLLIGVHDRLMEFSGTGYDFLAQLDVQAIVDHPEHYDALGEPRYFVCTNGQRDLCCARYGLPVYNLLRERVGDRVWQTTHLGGHRFAPNVLVLPGGLLHGRVTPDEVDGFVETCERGEVVFEHLRGRSRYPQHVQAAEAALGLDGVRLLHVDGDEDAASITFATASGSHSVHVARSPEPLMVQKSCGDEAEEVFPFRAEKTVS